MRKDQQKSRGIFIRVTNQEDRMIKELRKNHSTNVSQLVRNSIRDFYNKRTEK